MSIVESPGRSPLTSVKWEAAERTTKVFVSSGVPFGGVRGQLLLIHGEDRLHITVQRLQIILIWNERILKCGFRVAEFTKHSICVMKNAPFKGRKKKRNYFKEAQETTQGIHLLRLPGHKTQLR